MQRSPFRYEKQTNLGVRDPGCLVVVGTGIQWAGQTTRAAQRAIELADEVLFAVADSGAAEWIRQLSPAAESFAYPRDGRPRRAIYAAMVERILDSLAQGKRVCAVFYGCPAVLTQPAHDAVKRAREQGYPASMLAGVSFLDCLFADLAIDPGQEGCQVLEASSFLATKRFLDVHGHVVLCQVGLIGNRAAYDDNQELMRVGLALLRDRLLRDYPEQQSLTIYEAATQPAERPRIERLSLADLANAPVTGVSTLHISPRHRPEVDAHMAEQLAALSRLAQPSH